MSCLNFHVEITGREGKAKSLVEISGKITVVVFLEPTGSENCQILLPHSNLPCLLWPPPQGVQWLVQDSQSSTYT